jgi:hypothetical protein
LPGTIEPDSAKAVALAEAICAMNPRMALAVLEELRRRVSST